MVTFLIIAAALSVVVGLWLLSKDKPSNSDLNTETHPWTDDLAPEVTPAPIAETIAKKKDAPKKKAAKKTATKKTNKK